ncbi:phosphotransferase family protein [Psychrobacter sp.]|uniref:phosphotransferase family protein n=1 Tax=Psychrobacter sp. TaxID=56811 RepID=UPI0025FEFE42|nr:phosphotransferase family protein [Psychrobacter sp.]
MSIDQLNSTANDADSTSAIIDSDTDTLIDKPTKVRETETLDAKAVTQWLKSQNVDIQGTPEVTQFSGGASNWTYCLHYDNRDLILRRPPSGTKAKSAHDMVREFNIQQALKEDYPYVPEMIALCTDESVIGCDFYVMERLLGIIPRANLPKQLSLNTSEIHTLCTNVIDALIELHQIDYASNSQLTGIGKGEGYCERQVMGWDKRYKKAKTPNVPSFFIVRQWLKRNLPKDTRTCVIHNDWRFDNVVLDPKNPTSVIGVLDWEMATLGDPLMDLGSALAYWVQKDDNIIMRQSRRQPTHLKGMMSREQVVEYYLQKTGLSTENWAFYEVFGLFRLAGIAQQIYYRYYNKQTNNPAFKSFWIITHAINARALKLIAKHEASRLIDSGKLPTSVQSLAQRLVK